MVETSLILRAFVERVSARFPRTNGEVNVMTSGTLYASRPGIGKGGRLITEWEEVAYDRPESDAFMVRERPRSAQATHTRIALVDTLRALGYVAVSHGQKANRQTERSRYIKGATYTLFVKE